MSSDSASREHEGVLARSCLVGGKAAVTEQGLTSKGGCVAGAEDRGFKEIFYLAVYSNCRAPVQRKPASNLPVVARSVASERAR